MDLARFIELGDAYGGDLRQWPPAERAAATALLGRDPRAVAALEDAAALDAALAELPAPAPSEALVARVLRDAETVARRRPDGRSRSRRAARVRTRAWSVGVVGVAAAAGLAVGFFTPATNSASPQDQGASATLIALFANEQDGDEVAPL